MAKKEIKIKTCANPACAKKFINLEDTLQRGRKSKYCNPSCKRRFYYEKDKEKILRWQKKYDQAHTIDKSIKSRLYYQKRKSKQPFISS